MFSPIALCFKGDFFYGKNLAIATENNEYLDGLGALSLPQLTACSAVRSLCGLRPELAETDKDADASGVPRVILTHSAYSR